MLPVLPTYIFALSWAGLASCLLTVLLPLLTALAVKQSWPAPVKGVTLLFLAAIKAVAEAFVIGGQVNVGAVLYAVGLNFAIAVVAYLGLLRGSQLHTALLNSGNVDKPPAA